MPREDKGAGVGREWALEVAGGDLRAGRGVGLWWLRGAAYYFFRVTGCDFLPSPGYELGGFLLLLLLR